MDSIECRARGDSDRMMLQEQGKGMSAQADTPVLIVGDIPEADYLKMGAWPLG